MPWRKTPSRRACHLALRVCGLLGLWGVSGLSGESRYRTTLACAAERQAVKEARVQHFDFEQHGITDWHSVQGQWSIEDMPGAPSGQRVLVQRAVEHDFNVIVVPSAPYTDVDISVRFKPMAGREDASGGIVLRFDTGRYYVVRANALEDNFRLYAYERGRQQLATAQVSPPALGQWHTLRVLAVGDRIQGWLNGVLLLDHRDARFHAGQVGLWTKADSVTAFDALTIRAVTGDH